MLAQGKPLPLILAYICLQSENWVDMQKKIVLKGKYRCGSILVLCSKMRWWNGLHAPLDCNQTFICSHAKKKEDLQVENWQIGGYFELGTLSLACLFVCFSCQPISNPEFVVCCSNSGFCHLILLHATHHALVHQCYQVINGLKELLKKKTNIKHSLLNQNRSYLVCHAS